MRISMCAYGQYCTLNKFKKFSPIDIEVSFYISKIKKKTLLFFISVLVMKKKDPTAIDFQSTNTNAHDNQDMWYWPNIQLNF